MLFILSVADLFLKEGQTFRAQGWMTSSCIRVGTPAWTSPRTNTIFVLRVGVGDDLRKHPFYHSPIAWLLHWARKCHLACSTFPIFSSFTCKQRARLIRLLSCLSPLSCFCEGETGSLARVRFSMQAVGWC